MLAACASVPEPRLFPHAPTDVTARTDALLPTDVLMLGEQHDADEHQHIHRQVIEHLAVKGQLGAVAIEMADAGRSTASLKSNSTQLQVQDALGWNNKAWPWLAYGPAIMAAVKAGVPVMGANLPTAQMRDTMADIRLDQRLAGPALKAQQQLIRTGHCGLLPESQISPMTRIQIARDISMARTIEQAMLPGKVVVLLAGSGHVDRLLGVPQHLPQGTKIKTVQLRAGPARNAGDTSSFDTEWETPALAERDYCKDVLPKPAPK
ncbi:MAG TPA: ChaN family lipoprotein [Polaromonas sp.]|uniref:ChaN family lipoprotein n=1 Tax=Polaromonas sp. TaxID=1869339 RepID=UPI002D32915A|nr:ChaN family lipoprotein [Polaromonas sp.]HYW57106.1 ChaN family lipoprotein [Polaromonas sp.]